MTGYEGPEVVATRIEGVGVGVTSQDELAQPQKKRRANDTDQ